MYKRLPNTFFCPRNIVLSTAWWTHQTLLNHSQRWYWKKQIWPHSWLKVSQSYILQGNYAQLWLLKKNNMYQWKSFTWCLITKKIIYFHNYNQRFTKCSHCPNFRCLIEKEHDVSMKAECIAISLHLKEPQ